MIDQDAINKKLNAIAKKIVDAGKGILAADESESSIQKRFDKHDIENTEENRRKFRQIFITASGLHDKLGGVILHEETFAQNADNGKLFVDILIQNGISPGIKLDKGLVEYKNNEQVSVGLEDLEKKLNKQIYRKAKFAKWRSVFTIGDKTPTKDCIHANCEVLAKYALICQNFDIVPIVEPEILWEGVHSIENVEKAAKNIFSCLFHYLNLHQVYIPGVLLKPAFVTSGKDSKIKSDCNTVAEKTLECLMSTVPSGLPGVVFLSGGHDEEEATTYLNLINKINKTDTWKLTFSYGRALSDCVLKTWKGKDDNIEEAAKVFKKRLDETSNASLGKYK
ncbi:hypothetical protein BDAP_001445 [Binucleata daphniae]